VEVSLPLEFALAAFRFGHSMVRNNYSLNCYRPNVRLLELINEKKEAADRLFTAQTLLTCRRSRCCAVLIRVSRPVRKRPLHWE